MSYLQYKKKLEKEHFSSSYQTIFELFELTAVLDSSSEPIFTRIDSSKRHNLTRKWIAEILELVKKNMVDYCPTMPFYSKEI